MMNVELLKSAVAAIFKRKGKKYVTEEEFIFAASMELRWFPPVKASIFMKNAKKYGLLAATKEGLTPTFRLEDADLSQVISSPQEVADETESPNPVATIVELVSQRTGQPKSEVLSRINRLKRELNLETQASAVLVASQSGLDVTQLAKNALDELIANYGN